MTTPQKKLITATPEQLAFFCDAADEVAGTIVEKHREFIETLAYGTAKGFIVRRSVLNGFRGVEQTCDANLFEENRNAIIVELGSIVSEAFEAGVQAQRDITIKGLLRG